MWQSSVSPAHPGDERVGREQVGPTLVAGHHRASSQGRAGPGGKAGADTGPLSCTPLGPA